MAFSAGSLAGSARVVLGVDTRDFNRDLTQAGAHFNRTTKGMDADVGQLGRGVAAGSGAFKGFARSVAFASASFLGAAGFTALLKESVNAASDLEEAVNAATATFRGSSPAIRAWAEDAAASLGMSERAALQNATSIGAMLIPMGYARDNAAGMSQTMVQLATDMASFSNQDPSEMLDRIRAGLAGETEPLRRFGVDLRAASVNAFALETGLIKQGQTLSAQGQLWARYQLLLKQTADQQGDFERTSGGAANAQRTFRATIEKTQAALGKGFLPVLERLLPKLTGWANQLAENEELQKRLVDGVEDAVDVVGDMARTADTVADALGGWKDMLELIFALGVTAKVASMTKAFTLLAGAEAAAGAAAGTAGIAGAAGQAKILHSRLFKLSRLTTPIGILISLKLVEDDIYKWLADKGVDLPGSATGKGDSGVGDWVQRPGKYVHGVLFGTGGGGGGGVGDGDLRDGVGDASATMINKAAKVAGIPPALLAALVQQESGGKQSARSRSGAIGLTQLMPGTAQGLGVDPTKAMDNLVGGAVYLRQQLDKFKTVSLALSAYNSGPGGSESRGEVEKFRETIDYVKSVLENYKKFKSGAGSGAGSLGTLGSGAGVLAMPTTISRPGDGKYHPTAGLPGFPATDIFEKAGTPIGAPENGTITRTTGGSPEMTPAPLKGYSLYFVGNETGNTYFITHLAAVAKRGYYRRGDIIGTLAAGTTGGPHAHIGVHKGVAPGAYQSSTSSPPVPTASPSPGPVSGGGGGGGGGGGDLPEPTTPGAIAVDPKPKMKRKKSKGAATDPVLDRLELAAARAADTSDYRDDLKALDALDEYLTKKIALTKKISDKTQLVKDRQAVRAEIRDIGERNQQAELDRLELNQTKAGDTKRLTDDLKALEDIEAYLTKRIKLADSVQKKNELLKQRQGVRGEIEQVRTTIRDSKPLPPPVRIPGLEAVMGEIGQVSSGSQSIDLGGGLGKVLVPGVMKATHEAWQKMIVKLQAKLKTAITRRNGLKKALDRLGRIRGKLRDARLIQWHQQQIAALNKTIADIRNAIGEAMAAQNDLATAAAAQVKEDGEEQDRVDAQTARDTASANEAADASFQAGLVNMPADARLEMARAAGTADTSDDMAGLQAEKSRLEGNLGQGNMESEIGIVNALNSVNSQIARLIADAKTAADAADRLTEEAKKAADAAYQAGLLNMPVEARLAAARAGGTADNADDLALIREEKARLEAGLGKGSIETEIGIVNALNGLNNQLAQAAAAAASAEAGLLNMPSSLRLAMARAAGPGDELGLLRSERDRIESLSRSNTDEAELGYLNALKNVNGQIAQAAQAISAAALSMPVGLRLAAARAGGTADPADDLAVLRDELARLLTVGRSGEEGEIAYLNAVNGLKGQIEQGEKAAKALIDQAEQAAKQAAEAADSAYQVGLLNMPAAARLAMARAAGTVDKADDLALLRGEKTRLEAGLGKGSIETEISVVNALNSVDGQIAQLLEEAKRIAESTGTLVDIEKNREGFLQALRALRSDASNIYDPLSSLSGRTLQVQNFYSQPPPDSHMWSKQLEFELKALVG